MAKDRCVMIVEAKIPLKLFLNDKQTLVLKLRL